MSTQVSTEDQHRWRELKLFQLYRIFVGCTFIGLLTTPIQSELLPKANTATLPLIAVYVALAVGGWLYAWRVPQRLTLQILIAVGVDLCFGSLALFAFGGLGGGTGALLLVTVAMASLLLPGRLALLTAALATVAVLGEASLAMTLLKENSRNPIQAAFFSAGFFITVALFYWLAREARESQELAAASDSDRANLSQLNELIIQRMRTGIMVVDQDERIARRNESAWYLLGMPDPKVEHVHEISPDLHRRLRYWLSTGLHDNQPVHLAQGVPAVVPRFARMGPEEESAILVFLEDESMVSRRAEELTLSSLGRLAASIAHEVRNPLAAIHHAAQLLEESPDLPPTDLRLVEIINNHCVRMNGIVENVLQLSRRERAQPENLRLGPWLENFVQEFTQTHPPGTDQIKVILDRPQAQALVDPSHLNQVLWNLLRNALRYGRDLDRPAEIKLRVSMNDCGDRAIIEVIDRGPGIPPKVQQRLFEPFFTTHADGNGLGLYLVRQLVRANQGEVEYATVPGGGSCFRVLLVAPQAAAKALTGART
jgi:two-component system sensor histidine kinase PilS (NtrC family)